MRTLWEGRHLTVVADGGWEYAERRGALSAVAIVATDDEGRLLLVEQHRPPAGGRVLELPAGLVGDDGEENVEEAARRELDEETGHRAARVEVIGEFLSSPGLTSERFTLVRATGLTRVGDGGGVEAEDIAVHRVPVAEVVGFIAAKRAEGVGIDARLLLFLGEVID